MSSKNIGEILSVLSFFHQKLSLSTPLKYYSQTLSSSRALLAASTASFQTAPPEAFWFLRRLLTGQSTMLYSRLSEIFKVARRRPTDDSALKVRSLFLLLATKDLSKPMLTFYFSEEIKPHAQSQLTTSLVWQL